MRLPVSTPIGKLLRMSRRTLARLKANPKAKVLVVKLSPAHGALKAAQLAANDADDAALDTGAVVDECDANAREALVDFQLALVALVRRDYEDSRYVSYFPDGFNAAKTSSGSKLKGVLAGILDHAKDEPKDSKLLATLPALKDSVAAYKQPLLDDEAAGKALAKADTALSVAREQWLNTYDGLAGDLRSLFPRRKAFVDSFFPKTRASKPRTKKGKSGPQG